MNWVGVTMTVYDPITDVPALRSVLSNRTLSEAARMR